VRIRGKVVFVAGLVASLSAGWIGFPHLIYSSQPQPVEFSHQSHAEKAGMLCEDCHTLRADGTYTGVPALEECAGCHQYNLGPTEAEKSFIAQYVAAERDPEWAIYSRQPENVWFSHTPHVRLAEIECERCHGDHGTTEKSRVYQEDRISGYSRDIWGYTTALVGQAQGTSSEGVLTIPSMKMDDCIDCHDEEGLDHSCLDCHK